MDFLKALTQDQLRSDLPPINIGDTLKVFVKVKEGSRERTQMFEGTVIRKKNGGINESFTCAGSLTA
jgi:large subunit ribosomal protein L19